MSAYDHSKVNLMWTLVAKYTLYFCMPFTAKTLWQAVSVCCVLAGCDVSVSTSSSVDPYTASSEVTSNYGNTDKSVANGVSGLGGSMSAEEEEEPDGEVSLRTYKVPKMEQWLALRVHGGARSWPKFPSCFNNPNS